MKLKPNRRTVLNLWLAGLISGAAVGISLPSRADEPAPTASMPRNTAETVLRKMSAKLGAAQSFSFTAHREIESGLEGGDGLSGNTKIDVLVQRPDKVMARAKIPDEVRCLYFDGKQLTLADEKKKIYSTVPLAMTLDGLPSELAKLYGFTPPVAEFLVNDLYRDLAFRAKGFEYRGIGTIDSGFLGLGHVRCHRVGLTGTAADSEIWIGVDDLLPRRWNSIVKGDHGSVEIKLEFSDWNLKAKTGEEKFVFTPKKDAIEIPMMKRAEMEAALNQKQ